MIRVNPGNGETISYSEIITAGVTDLGDKNFNAIYNGVTQNVTIQFIQGDPVQFVGLPAGTIIKGYIKKVTAGNSILGLILE